MLLPIEYLLRNKRAQHLFACPSSLFLENNENKLVLIFEGQDLIKVTKFYICQRVKNRILPFHDVFHVAKEDIFFDDRIIITNYQPVYFNYKIPHNGDLPPEDFLNSGSYQDKKMGWLWDTFEQFYMEPHIKEENGIETIVYDRRISRHWYVWRKHMLEFDNLVANELIFLTVYPLPKKMLMKMPSVYNLIH